MKTRKVILMALVFGVIYAQPEPCLAKESVNKNAKSLNEVLEIAYSSNASIAALRHSMDAEESLIASSATLDDPMVGINTLDRGMETQYATISQKIRFPTKYYLQAKVQSHRAKSSKQELEAEKLKVRGEIASFYFSIYSTQKIIQLTEANMQAVKEFARVAEKKYAAGKSTQADSMKAHFELTQLELELIRLRQEEESLQNNLRSVLNNTDFHDLELAQVEITAPQYDISKIKSGLPELTSSLQDNSPTLKKEQYLLKAAESQSELAAWEFAPDFQLQYQQRVSGDPTDSRIYSVGVTIPLWFWKKGSEASAASSRKLAQEYRLTDATQKLIAKVKDLKGKVETGSKTLKIYETSLIPQAQGAFNSTRAAYRANKTSFLDLLDSERSLYRVRTGFFQTLRQFVQQLGELEANLDTQYQI